jgi:hypothetical protein
MSAVLRNISWKTSIFCGVDGRIQRVANPRAAPLVLEEFAQQETRVSTPRVDNLAIEWSEFSS